VMQVMQVVSLCRASGLPVLSDDLRPIPPYRSQRSETNRRTAMTDDFLRR
jgi:hypothetical protein